MGYQKNQSIGEKIRDLPYYQWRAFGRNLLKFTAPILTIFFAQLALGVDWKIAGVVALYALYAALSDFFKKINET